VSSVAAGLNLWWRQNDGLGGHVFLGPAQLAQLGREMLAQGMAWSGDEGGTGIPLSSLEPGETVAVAQVDEALAVASPTAQTLADHDLWRDWLDFLEGAAEHGGLIAA
jgi:hypothetical protein